jgi:hypothetical protein
VSVALLPDSYLHRSDRTVERAGVPHKPIFCANCGKSGGLVVADSSYSCFAFYLCEPCAETYGDIDGHFMVPDDVFAEKVKQEQLEKYGRLLTKHEFAEALNDPHTSLAKLAKEKP